MSSPPIKGAYYPCESNLNPAAIETQYFTHIYYAFLNPEYGSFQFVISPDEANRLQNFTNTLHAKSPTMKILFSVGGAKAGPAILSLMASNVQSRTAFISSSIQVARAYGFDGVDLDWEFPQDKTQMDNLGSLLEEWRSEVQREAGNTGRTQLLLTAAVYFGKRITSPTPWEFPADSMRENLDFINVMTYDYYGNWDTTATGAQAALYGPSPQADKSTDHGLRSWIEAGVPPSKLVMGMPLYGRTWTLENSQESGIGARAVGVGPGDHGVLPYADVVAFNLNNNARVERHEPTGSAYSVAGIAWISYDDTWSVSKKVEYAKTLGLGGYFFWPVDGDHQWDLSSKASNLWPLNE